MKIVVEIEIDQAAYDEKYGPQSEYWQKYKTSRVEGLSANGETVWQDVVKPASEYEFAEGKAEQALGELLVDVINEGLHDWRHLREDGSTLQVTIDGKLACAYCGKLEGHKDWCGKIVGEEPSEDN